MTAIAFRKRASSRVRRINPGLRQPLAIAGAVIAICWVLIAIFAPLLAPANPLAQNFTPSVGPSWSHLFGTDELGRDVLSRVIYGARVTLPIGLVIVLLAATVGATIGAISGYFRGPLDGLFMRGTDLVFAFPPIILAMVVAAVLGRSLANAAVAIVIVAWPPYARIVRGLVMNVGDTEYVQSARLLGASARRALFKDVLPNVAGPVLVLMTLDLATAILLLSGLSFLGLGAQPPQAEWGIDGLGRDAVLPVVVDGDVPRARDLHGRARLQLPRRQPSRRLRSPHRLAPRRELVSLLEVAGLRVRLQGASGMVTVVDGVDYQVEQGEVFGVAGESGSGKTMSMLALLGILPDGAEVEEASASRAASCSGCPPRSCVRSLAATSRWSSRIR